MTTLVNTFEGGTNGVTVSAANSGGGSGNAFDSVSIGTGGTFIYDTTNTQGALAAKIATAGTNSTVFGTWSTAMGTQTTVWYRLYLYLTANPSFTDKFFAGLSSATVRSDTCIDNTGKLTVLNAAGSRIFTFTGTVPLNAWFRIEGFVTGNASTGQVELKQFNDPASATATETQTSAASVNTGGTMDTYEFGMPVTPSANNGPFWMDNIGLSSTGYLGPATVTSPGVMPAIIP